MGVALFSNHTSMSIGSPLTHRCLPLSSLDFMTEFYMMCSYRRWLAWDNAPNSRIMVSLLLPGPMEADQWLHKVRANRHMWPLQMTSHPAANQLPTELFMRREQETACAAYLGVDPTRLAHDQGAGLDQTCYWVSIHCAAQTPLPPRVY